jgi:rhamnose utilization protein RhaD (predicted bifunctional aldolase and dehydrogenase)
MILSLDNEEYLQLSKELINISKKLGERFDLVQAGGGNVSFKIGNYMFIKSSGCNLTELDLNKNIVGLDYIKIKDNFVINDRDKKTRELKTKTLVNNNIIFLKQYKPSIETVMHSICQKFTIHLHPIQFNKISSLSNCDIILNKLFENYLLIDYFTPGIDVALEINKYYKNEKIIFLKNHGIVFTSNDLTELEELIDDTINKLENYLKLDFNKYKYVNQISKSLEIKFKNSFITYLSEDTEIQKYDLNEEMLQTFIPDKLVYCGKSIIKIDKLNLEKENQNYYQKYKEIPKLFLKDKNLYISSNSLKKCYEIESVLKSHLLCYNPNNLLLEKEELDYLNNWEAEKFRKL